MQKQKSTGSETRPAPVVLPDGPRSLALYVHLAAVSLTVGRVVVFHAVRRLLELVCLLLVLLLSGRKVARIATHAHRQPVALAETVANVFHRQLAAVRAIAAANAATFASATVVTATDASQVLVLGLRVEFFLGRRRWHRASVADHLVVLCHGLRTQKNQLASEMIFFLFARSIGLGVMLCGNFFFIT